MARKLLKPFVSVGAALSPELLKLFVQKRYYGLNKKITLKKLSEYAQVGIHPGSREFKIFYAAGLIDHIDNELINQTKSYHCKTIGDPLDPIVNIACQQLNGVSDVRFLSRSFYWSSLIPYLNDMAQHDTYTEKNLYTKHLPIANQPQTILKSINGFYFDRDDKPVKGSLLQSYVGGLRGDFIIKPSRTANGESINLLAFRKEGFFLSKEKKKWYEIEEVYGKDFVIQEKIVQHGVMAEPHPDSVNTMRILTLRWDGEIHFMMAFARFGSNGRVNDNAGTGGVCVGIDKDGKFSEFAVNADARRIDAHPSTGYQFSQQKEAPGFHAAVNLCLELHNEVMHHNLVSWDIAIDPSGRPIFIEHNFRGALWLYQLTTGKPVLGHLTDEILSSMRKRNAWQAA